MIEQTLLDKFNEYKTKKSQKRMAKEYGFESAEAFKVHLEQKIQQEAGVESKPGEDKEAQIPVIRNVHIIDRSGSMHGRKLLNAVKGVNEELKALQKDDTVEYTQTLVAFDTRMTYRVKEVPIKEAEEIVLYSGGSTALYATIGTVLDDMVETYTPGTKTLVKIFTDGEENSSRGKYSDPKVLHNLIQECEEEYEFTITFVGTKWDIERVMKETGIRGSNTMSHDNTERGVKMSFGQTTDATMAYSKKVKEGEDVTGGFYKKINEKK